MSNYRTVLPMVFLLLLAACTPSEPTSKPASAEATRPSLTSVPIEPTAITAPTPTAPASPDLAAFVKELKTAIAGQNYVGMQVLMSDSIAVGARQSEWRESTPSLTVEQFQNSSLPSPQAVQFTGLSEEEITILIGQPPATMFGPNTHIVSALHSIGWGQSSSDEAILFIAEADGRFTWHAFLYTSGRFEDANLGAVAAPVGLIYMSPDNGLFQIQVGGQQRQLLDAQTANIPNLKISPDGRHAAYLTDDRQLMLINTTTGEHQQLAGDLNLYNYLAWGSSSTLFIGVWITPDEGEGPNNGHIATLEINSGDLKILDEERLSGNRPALLPDYNMVAFDVFTSDPDDSLNGRLFHPDSGLQTFDPVTFSANGDVIQGQLFNPAWPAGGGRIAWLASTGERFAVQVFDLETTTVVQIYDWDPARFGGLVPSPVWSPGGQWIALEVWANGIDGMSLWLLNSGGGDQRQVAGDGSNPYWFNEDQLIFVQGDQPFLYDVPSGDTFPMDLPEGSVFIALTPIADLTGSSDTSPVVETAVSYVQAMQDVTMYNGPGETYQEIGFVADGQTALVTGQSPDRGWWRVICPDDSIGDCWVTADADYMVPIDAGTTLVYPDPANLPVTNETMMPSPDGRWQAIAAQSDPILVNASEHFYVSLTVADGDTSWTPVAEWRGYGLGYLWPAVYRWSPDGRYLYYTNMAVPDGCAGFVNGTDLYRLDLSDGSIVEILPPNSTLSLSLSPEGNSVAFTRYNGQAQLFVLQEIGGGERSVILTDPGTSASPLEIFWSPDGRSAALTLVDDACTQMTTSSIVYVQTETLSAKPLIEHDSRGFLIRDWAGTNNNQIRLVDKDQKSWLLDVNSGELAQES